MLRAFQFGVVLLGLAILAMLSAIITMHFAIHGAEVTVPAFKGLTVSEAAGKAASLGLNLSVDNHFYSIDIPAGRIVSQSPAPGTVVRREWHVRITESLGPQRVAIPNLMGLDQRVASIQIRRAALEIGSTAQMPWAYAPEGAVIAQDPTPGSAGVARPSVGLLLATQPAATGNAFVMPDFTGQEFTVAALAVTHAGLTLAPVKQQTFAISTVAAVNSAQAMQAVLPIGSILHQNPQPGQRVDASIPIEFTVVQ